MSDAEALLLTGFGAPSEINLQDDAHLTVLVLPQPGVPVENVKAIRRAIQAWNAVLQECFDGALSITEMTGGPQAIKSADVVLRYTAHRGGAKTAGSAVCLPRACDVYVSSESPSGYSYSPHTVYLLTLHELGHVLGLGHTTNLWESQTDVMAYGYGPDADIEISQCNVDALAHVWSWAIEGTQPARPTDLVYDCGTS